jgi:ethanolamine ammonia-lyase small subunit
MKKEIIQNPWEDLRKFTDARIALGRAGVSLPTSKLLEFNLAHAKARDAVHTPLHVNKIQEQLSQINLQKTLHLHSLAKERTMYLQRPDLGRRLDENSLKIFKELNSLNEGKFDIAFVIADGLSAFGVEENAVNFIKELAKDLQKQNYKLAPISIVEQGRVAIGDEIGELLHVKLVIVLIGERPGLSSPDSLGLYMTYNPKVGLSDESRNCISNIRIAGLSYKEAARKAMYLICESIRLELSGVGLKDRTSDNIIEAKLSEKNFLLL